MDRDRPGEHTADIPGAPFVMKISAVYSVHPIRAGIFGSRVLPVRPAVTQYYITWNEKSLLKISPTSPGESSVAGCAGLETD